MGLRNSKTLLADSFSLHYGHAPSIQVGCISTTGWAQSKVSYLPLEKSKFQLLSSGPSLGVGQESILSVFWILKWLFTKRYFSSTIFYCFFVAVHGSINITYEGNSYFWPKNMRGPKKKGAWVVVKGERNNQGNVTFNNNQLKHFTR